MLKIRSGEYKRGRLKKIERRIYNPKSCPDCRGTGTLVGRKPGSMGSGCARCLVRAKRTIISDKDLRWLIRLARRSR